MFLSVWVFWRAVENNCEPRYFVCGQCGGNWWGHKYA